MRRITISLILIIFTCITLTTSIVNCGEVDVGQAVYVGDEIVKDYHPKSSLITEKHEISKPKFPVIDIHTHFSLETDPAFLIKRMDALGIQQIVNLSGGYGKKLEQMVEKFYKPYPDRIIIFCNINFSTIDNTDFGRETAEYLEKAHTLGAKGVKIFKTLGLTIKDKTGKIIPVDDPRLDSVWSTAGKLGMPVLIHTADPIAFFKPVDKNNERWLQLKRHSDWSFHGQKFPSRKELIAQRNRVLARHPKTVFIGAHIGGSAEDLKSAGETLNKYPNFYMDIAGRVAELGRQPYSARNFLIQFQDRILFGTDRYPGRVDQPRYKIYYRFLETNDEYFDYYDHDFPPGGEWKIYGVFLPDSVLKKIYRLNAKRVFYH
ncbi:MAG: amidohydrolase family protein [Candidatus Anammoxibacter sp.]